jgi:hypothetical protein
MLGSAPATAGLNREEGVVGVGLGGRWVGGERFIANLVTVSEFAELVTVLTV